MRYFEKRMGLKGKNPPKNYAELKEEILKWSRVGLQKQGDQKTSGYLRKNPDFNHIYPTIEQDVEKLLDEGYLMEFKDKSICDKISKKNKDNSTNNRNNEEIASILYPINLDENKDIEVRGSKSQYPSESLTILS